MSWKMTAFDDGENEHHWLVERVAAGYRCTITVRLEGESEPGSGPDVVEFATVDELVQYLAGDPDVFLLSATERLAEMIRHG